MERGRSASDRRDKLKVLDLFSGIGGFSLGLERAGFETIAFCEIEPFCQKVLKRHWPGIPIYSDVRELTYERLKTDGINPEVITGGFPCQDVSLAGRRTGMGNTRSGLWTELARIIGEVRPEIAIMENTTGLLSLGMGNVLGDLASLGYDAEWHCIPACYVGADHIRDRVWIIAYPDGWQSINERWPNQQQEEVAENVTNIMREGLQRRGNTRKDSKNEGEFKARPRFAFNAAPAFPREYRKYKPVLGRGVHGIPGRVDRIKALGNAVVPQIPEIIGRAILKNPSQQENDYEIQNKS